MLKKLLIILLSALCLALSLAYRTGGMSPSDFIDASPDKTIQTWQVAHPETLLKQSDRALEQNNPELAKQQALEALSKNITNGLAFAQLVTVAAKDDKLGLDAAKLAPLAEQLWPAHIGVQIKLASYWQVQNNLPKLMHAWHILMVRAPSLRKDIYPILFKLLSYQEGLEVLKNYTENPPSWWLGFFNYTAQQEQSLSQLRVLYNLRDTDTTTLTQEERATFINSLIKSKLWEEAYFVWLAGLNENQLNESGFIHNGSFENTDKTAGFDWQFAKSPLVKTEIAATNGMVGQRALHLSLNDKDRINFRHISQVTKLNAGLYNFSARARVDNLQTGEGLRWRMHCMNDKSTLLGETPALAKRRPWEELKFDFEVPANDCTFQIVRLETSSPFVNNHFFKGSLWFDDLRITRQLAKPQ